MVEDREMKGTTILFFYSLILYGLLLFIARDIHLIKEKIYGIYEIKDVQEQGRERN